MPIDKPALSLTGEGCSKTPKAVKTLHSDKLRTTHFKVFMALAEVPNGREKKYAFERIGGVETAVRTQQTQTRTVIQRTSNCSVTKSTEPPPKNVPKWNLTSDVTHLRIRRKRDTSIFSSILLFSFIPRTGRRSQARETEERQRERKK